MILSGADYHRHTSYDRYDMKGHFLDWPNKPDIYKEYSVSEKVALSRDIPKPDETFSRLIEKADSRDRSDHLSLEKLCQIFALAYTLTSKRRYPGGEFLHRSVPSAGGLYPCELYVAVQSVSELDDGLYHYSVGQHLLARLREGRFSEKNALLTFFITAVFFRSAWKYRDRSYRYHLLDTGHTAENLILTLKSLDLPFEQNDDFDDQKVGHLLGLDPQKEVCLTRIHVPSKEISSGTPDREAEALPELFHEANRISPTEIHYPALEAIHTAASRVITPQTPLPDMLPNLGPDMSPWKKVEPPEEWPEKMNYAEAVLKRRSLRNFVTKRLPKTHFDALLTFLCHADGRPDPLHEKSVCTGFLAGDVEGLDPGCYWINSSETSVALSRPGVWMDKMAHICLEQEWLAGAALHFFFATNLTLLDQTYGARGYRYAMITAGRLAQKIYIGSTALELGCCGIGAFFDNEASELLGLNNDSKMLYLVGAGPVKKAF